MAKKYDSNMKDFLKTLGEGLLSALRINPRGSDILPTGTPMQLAQPPAGGYGSFVQQDGSVAGNPSTDAQSNFSPMLSTVPEDLKPHVLGAAKKYSLPPREFSALLARESGNYNPDVMYGRQKSSMGATGVGQFMPGTLNEMKRIGYQPFDPNNPQEAVYASAHYLNNLGNVIGNKDFYEIAKAYNAGAGNYQNYKGNIPFEETKKYIEYIKELVDADNNKSKK